MLEFVLRPSLRHRPLVLPAILIVAMCVVVGARFGWPGVLVGFAVAAVAIVVPLAGYLRRARIVVTPSQITVRGLVTHKRADRDQAASIVRAVIVAPRAPMNDTIFVLDRDEKLLLRIHGVDYPTADLDRLVEVLGLPATTADRPVTATEVARRYPGLVPWIQRHPVMFALAATLVIVVVVIPVAVTIALSIIG